MKRNLVFFLLAILILSSFIRTSGRIHVDNQVNMKVETSNHNFPFDTEANNFNPTLDPIHALFTEEIILDTNALIAANSFQGDGSSGNPYHLNQSIFMSKSIIIANTNVYTVINGFDIQDYGSIGQNSTWITLKEASNIEIRNNSVTYPDVGITIMRSNNINVTDNILIALRSSIELAGATNIVLSNNTLTSYHSSIYFSYLERDYGRINSGSQVPSQQLTIVNNTLISGLIDIYFPLRYNPDLLFSYTIEDNLFLSHGGSNIFAEIVIDENLVDLSFADQVLGQLIVRNVNMVALNNVTMYSNIYISNCQESVIINDLQTAPNNVHGYLSSNINITLTPEVYITNSNMSQMSKYAPPDREAGYYQNNTNYPQFYEKYLVNYMQISDVEHVEITDNLVNASQIAATSIQLNRVDSSLIDGNDFINSDYTYHSPVYVTNPGYTRVTNNNFLAYVSATDHNYTNIELVTLINTNYTLARNFYGFYQPYHTDLNEDGYVDGNYTVYDAFWDPPTSVMDWTARTSITDILNFTLSSEFVGTPTVNETISLEWSAYIPRGITNYRLYFLNDTTWQELEIVSDMMQLSLDTRQFENGEVFYQLNATNNYELFNITAMRSLSFSLNINNQVPVSTDISSTTGPQSSSSTTSQITTSSEMTTTTSTQNSDDKITSTEDNETEGSFLPISYWLIFFALVVIPSVRKKINVSKI